MENSDAMDVPSGTRISRAYGRTRTPEFGFITCANDRMASQLQIILTSIRHYHPEAPISIIPFSDDFKQCHLIAREFLASVVDLDETWDVLGRAIFAGRAY